MNKFVRIASIFCWAWVMSLPPAAFAGGSFLERPAGTPGSLAVRTTPAKARPGDTVKIRIELPPSFPRDLASGLRAVLLTPRAGCSELPLSQEEEEPGARTAEIRLDESSAEGLYAVHAWTGDAGKPDFLGKSTFLVGKIILDFPVMSLVDKNDPDADVRKYLEEFQGLGGNSLIVHVLIDGTKAYYGSRIAETDIEAKSPQDIVEAFLRHADRLGFACHMSVNWDMTHNTDYKTCMAEIKALIHEIYALYGHHPSLVGFYSYQEGSGTYLVPYLREFCDFVKSLHPNLVTSCAPYVDDPLLAGYMSVLESLDLIIFQGMTMASYRPDNVKRYPLRRVRDFCGVGIGAKWLQDKIAVTHTELFGYMENRISAKHSTTTYENIYPQILSAAAAAGSDGVSFFTYHSNIYTNMKKSPELAPSRRAVEDGLRAFRLIWDKVSRAPNPIAFYFPYSDWVIERYANYFLPAFDAFRALGIPADFLPYAPPFHQSVYPFYPYHKNDTALDRLLKDKTVLVLPNVSGFHVTDSEFIKAFVERGGAVVAFGPQIPFGNTYDRAGLFGGEDSGSRSRAEVRIENPVGGRAAAGNAYPLDGRPLASWRPGTAKVIAAYDDGSAAVLANRFGKGLAVAVTMDAAAAARFIPDVVRDVVDYASRAAGSSPAVVDILGLNEDTDAAVRPGETGFSVAVINHNPHPIEITLKPITAGSAPESGWIDLVSRTPVQSPAGASALKRTIPARQFLCLEYRAR